MAGEHKKEFWSACLGALMGEGGRLRYNLESVADETGIPAKSLRQFKQTGILGDKYCDSLARYLFGADRWTDVLSQPKPETKKSMDVVDLLTKLIGDVALLRKEVEDLRAEVHTHHHPTQGGQRKSR